MASTSSNSFFASSLDSPRLSVLVMFNKKIMCCDASWGGHDDHGLQLDQAREYPASLFLSCKRRTHSCSILFAIFTLDSRLNRSNISELGWSFDVLILTSNLLPPPLKSFNLRGPSYLSSDQINNLRYYILPPLNSFSLEGPSYLANSATAWTKKLETETRRSWSFSNQVSTWRRGGWQWCCID